MLPDTEDSAGLQLFGPTLDLQPWISLAPSLFIAGGVGVGVCVDNSGWAGEGGGGRQSLYWGCALDNGGKDGQCRMFVIPMSVVLLLPYKHNQIYEGHDVRSSAVNVNSS